MASVPITLVLEAVAGPHPLRVECSEPREHVVGRAVGSAVLLDDPTTIVSRRHAIIEPDDDGGWRIIDLESKHGTRLNGIALAAQRPVPIKPGDLLSIGPWTLMAGVPSSNATSTMSRTLTDDDRGSVDRSVRAVRAVTDAALAGERVQILLRVAEQMQDCDSPEKLGDVVARAVAEGTRFGNVALLRPMTTDGGVDVICVRTESGVHPIQFRFSRSILQQATAGTVVTRSRADLPADIENSLATLDISEALCVPLLSEGVVLALLYMDNRHGKRTGRGGGDDQAFATALGRIAALALRGLFLRKYQAAQAELDAAAKMQRLMLPSDVGRAPRLIYAGSYRPGRVVSGDFFDIMPLDDGRTAALIGDVAGKGVGAAVLATLTQGFVRGVMRGTGSIDEAVRALNSFIWARAELERFVTLWLGVIDPEQGTLRYVDAGHGLSLFLRPDRTQVALIEGGGPPLGAVANPQYASVETLFDLDSVLLLASDGVVEQPVAGGSASEAVDRFGIPRLAEAVDAQLSPEGIVGAVFRAVVRYGGTENLADDATVVAIKRED